MATKEGQTGRDKPQPKTANSPGEDLTRVLRMCWYALAFGIAVSVLFSIAGSSNWSERVGVLAGSLLIGGAAAFVGGVVGFLFAVPRSRQDQTVAQAGANVSSAPRRLSDYAANTNLEQISDWLTKIIVGVSLVELKGIPARYKAVAASVSPLLGAGTSAQPAALALMTYALAMGFFVAYLLTRLWMPKALSRAEREEQERIRQVERDAQLSDVEGKAYKYLYEPVPSGFKKAIELIDSYYSDPGSPRSGSLALYLAAANGQRHAWAIDERARAEKIGDAAKAAAADEEAQKARKRVREAVLEALRLSPETRPILEQLYEGRDTNENDLVTLKGDEDLDALLMGPKPATGGRGA